jgi:dihydroneopterin aldolase
VRAKGSSRPPREGAQPVLQPELVYLSNAAIASPHLKEWIDQLESGARPLIICVGPSDTPAPQTFHKMAQRRIDLLAIEQNAWVLAARDPRCVVVATRTELDWAMKNGQTCVWAPSKIVLDAVDGPSAQPSDAVALAAWFAATFDAGEMLVIGAELPKSASVPLRSLPVDSAAL